MNELTDRTTLAFQAGTDPWTLGLAAVAALVLLALGVASVRNVSGGRRWVLVALRALLALSVVLLALQPVLRRERLAISTVPVAVVVDASASMDVRDQDAGRSRLDAVGAWLAQHAAQVDALEGRAVVDWFAASGGTVRAITRQDAAAGRLQAGGGTDLLASLEEIAERYPGGRRPAVLLFSDGADHGALRQLVRSGADLAPHLDEGGPVTAIAPESGRLADLALDLVAHDPVAFLRTDLTVRVKVRAEGLPAAQVPVSLLRGDAIVTVRPVTVGGPTREAEVTFTIEPTTVGEALYFVEVPVQAGEAVPGNNTAAFSVRVVRDRLRVLQVVGRPSWDGRFLRELLKRDPAIDLISFFILRSAWDDTNAEVDELSLIPFPVTELFGEKLAGFDLVIFQNFDFGPYGIQPHLGELRRHVEERGGGLAIIGGDLAFGADYRSPELTAILPVEAGPRAAWVPDTVRLSLTAAGARHPVVRLGSTRPAEPGTVEELLPVSGVNAGLSPVPGAQVLYEEAGPGRRPLVVASDSGAGRVMVVATDGTWRWSLPAAGRGTSPRGYERFWQNAMRWLVRDPRSALVVLDSDRRVVGATEPARIGVQVFSDDYAPRAGAVVQLVVADAAGDVVLEQELRTGDEGTATHELQPPRPGVYAVTARSEGGEAGPVFVEREDESDELRDPAIDLELLRALAEATGGRAERLDEGDARVPLPEARDVRVQSAQVTPLWRSWPAWALVAGLACVEWWLRRRWGLA